MKFSWTELAFICGGVLLSFALFFGSLSKSLPITIPEVLGFLTGAACVTLVVRKSIWNFAFGIASSVFFAFLFWKGHLWWDMSLQGVFIALSISGWIQWAHGVNTDSLPIRRADARVLLACCLLIAILTPAMMRISMHYNGAAPFWDSLTTALSLVAQGFLNRKLLENWYFWILADLIYIPLYFSRELYLTSFLYLVFLMLCIAGFRAWKLEMNNRQLPKALA